MALATADDFSPDHVTSEVAKPGHTLRPILVTVFTLKFAVAALLLACVSVSPPVAAHGGYFVAE